jgi:hypothetical protein
LSRQIQIIYDRIIEVWMIEEIEGVGLELQCKLVREVEPSSQSQIELVERKPRMS